MAKTCSHDFKPGIPCTKIHKDNVCPGHSMKKRGLTRKRKPKPKRNDRCGCNSGKKYKKCCLFK